MKESAMNFALLCFAGAFDLRLEFFTLLQKQSQRGRSIQTLYVLGKFREEGGSPWETW